MRIDGRIGDAIRLEVFGPENPGDSLDRFEGVDDASDDGSAVAGLHEVDHDAPAFGQHWHRSADHAWAFHLDQTGIAQHHVWENRAAIREEAMIGDDQQRRPAG